MAEKLFGKLKSQRNRALESEVRLRERIAKLQIKMHKADDETRKIIQKEIEEIQQERLTAKAEGERLNDYILENDRNE